MSANSTAATQFQIVIVVRSAMCHKVSIYPATSSIFISVPFTVAGFGFIFLWAIHAQEADCAASQQPIYVVGHELPQR
jgi:hypothetical protein